MTKIQTSRRDCVEIRTHFAPLTRLSTLFLCHIHGNFLFRYLNSNAM